MATRQLAHGVEACRWCDELFVPSVVGGLKVKLGKRTVAGEAAAAVCPECAKALGLDRLTEGDDGDATTDLPETN